MSNEQNDAIQGLRGIAALLVVITHAILTLDERGMHNTLSIDLAYGLGELGVRVFFVISGFIMTLTMYDAFGRKGAPLVFLSKRLARIVPLYWIVTLLFVAKSTFSGEAPPLDEVVLSLAFIPYDHGQALRAPIYALGWTLNYEMFFYCLFSLSIIMRRRTGLLFLLGSLAALGAIGYLDYLEGCVGGGCAITHNFTRPIILYFAGGIILALFRKWLQRLGYLPPIETGNAIIICLIVILLYGATVYVGFAPEDSDASLAAQLTVCAIVTVACGFATSSQRGSPFRTIFLVLGDASYSIYLTHSILMGPAGRLWASFSNGDGALLFIFAMIVGSSILGILSYRYIEKPALNFLRPRLPHNRPIFT